VVVLSSIMAIVLTQVFAIRTGIPGYYWSVLTILLIASFTSAALYALYRLHALLRATVEEQARIDRLRRYFSPQVAAVLEENEAGVEDSVTRTITVLFGDIRGFTTITLNEPPGRVLELLNEYHAVMVDRIFDTGGTLDKFIGDGVMAYFNAPLEQPDHAERAIRCATSMMEGLAELNRRRAARGEAALRMGIGIHTGPATLGSIGPAVRREYTAIGETVNLAAHVEQLTRLTDGGILLTESTRRGLEEGYAIEPRPDLSLGDGERPLSLYRLVTPDVAS
ncbi:MAG TPA: adenylate/guanylate cyclase domain-containing protein, partial [Gemmatimonadota bacterium]|nr:adenylate/guanylate cyclase domain-containing protein [Gemmatimonadota bacterium]